MRVCAGPWRRRGERIYFTLAIKQRIVLGTMSIRGGSEERERARARTRERETLLGAALVASLAYVDYIKQRNTT